MFALMAFNKDCLLWFQSVLTAHNGLRTGSINTDFEAVICSLIIDMEAQPWYYYDSMRLGLSQKNYFLSPGHNTMQKSFLPLLFKQLFKSKQTPFNCFGFQLVRYAISLLLNHFHHHRFELLSRSQCLFFSTLTLVFIKWCLQSRIFENLFFPPLCQCWMEKWMTHDTFFH